MSENTNPAFTNRLISESSPYLLQHAHNPVDWYSWNKEAFTKAREEDKLIIISIGYSACHWCHVMERESFEDEQVAKLMNDHFVCIKVDREERPDVDQIYMDAAQLITGRGGWPLNVVTLPDGRPVYACTYLPKLQWTGILRHMAFDFGKQREKFMDYAEKLTKGIIALNETELPEFSNQFTKEQLDTVYASHAYNFDKRNGGNGRAPKFPMPDNYFFLLRYHHLSHNTQALEQVYLTLDKMATGGIYDQLGGGFARYATDEEWKIPHFEKMLYDNAQLISLYSEAWQQSKNPLYKKTVYQTIDFLERELCSPDGGFYSALDADSEGVEGKYYTWTIEEFNSIVGEDALIIGAWFGVGKEGYWEHDQNILVQPHTMEYMEETFQLPWEQIEQKIKKAELALNEARNKRIRPGLDNKILLAWNALVLKGLFDAYKAFAEERFLQLAQKNLSFIQKNMVDGVLLIRTLHTGSNKIPAFLEDYSLYCQALLEYYQLCFDEKYLQEADALIMHIIDEFGDNNNNMFYFTSKSNHELIARKIELSDNVISSPNSIMAHNLFKAGILLDKAEYTERAKRMLETALPRVIEHGAFFSNWAVLLCNVSYPFYELAICGPDAVDNRIEIEGTYIPNKLCLGTINDKSTLSLLQDKYSQQETLYYVCSNKSCLLPTPDSDKAISMLMGQL